MKTAQKIFLEYIKQNLDEYIITEGEQFIPFSPDSVIHYECAVFSLSQEAINFESELSACYKLDFKVPPESSISQDESFSQMLVRKIHELGISNSDCYKKAHVDRRHFSKILSNPHYSPTKPTVLAFALALELTLDECNEMLAKAGYCFSKSLKFDLIIEYFIKNEEYDILLINQALHYYNQPML